MKLSRSSYLALACITCATMMLQVTITRVFSVMMWYHLSLVAVSMTMFGMTVGALYVHYRRDAYRPENAMRACQRHALWFGVSMAVSLIACLNTPFLVRTTVMGMLAMAWWMAVAGMPFVFSGIVVCLALTRFPEKVGRMYAADLGGAAAGCLVVVWLLDQVDAISAILLVASLAAGGAWLFSKADRDGAARASTESDARPPAGRANKATWMAAVVLLLIGLLNAQPALLVRLGISQTPTHWIRLQYTPDRYIGEETWRHEFWNVFSYVTVTEPLDLPQYWGPGRNATWSKDRLHLRVTMDTRASTAMVNFNGDWDAYDWMLDDVVHSVHTLRPDGPALVIGTGAGRDVLASLLPSHGTREVTGVDINPNMIALLTKYEVNFSGGIANLPNVTLLVDEARSWLKRHDNKYALITVPLVDTSAASAAGAYALTENTLYTVEAFELFLDRLADDGVLSVSRWWYAGRIGETHRLVGLAAAALRARGVTHPEDHIIVLRGGDIATLLVSREPFTPADYETVRQEMDKRGFDPLLSPAGAADPLLAAAARDPNWPAGQAFTDVLDLSPPTDDRPYFFHSYRLANLFAARGGGWVDRGFGGDQAGVPFFDRDAMLVLMTLVLWLTLLLAATMLVPLVSGRGTAAGIATGGSRFAALTYFTAIGLGFMFFESAQLQRLNVFLGYPVYALSVVLFTLLLAASLGSWLAGWMWDQLGRRWLPIMLAVVGLALLATGWFSPALIDQQGGATTPIRIALAVAMIAPAGIALGMMFPTGLRLTSRQHENMLAWCWAANGMASTYAAVVSIALAISLGITIVYWAALGCYVVAGLAGWKLRADDRDNMVSAARLSRPRG